MSLILEALRKSEAERRRGELPGLLSEPRPVPRPGRAGGSRGLPWIIAGVLAVAVALPVVWLLRDGSAGADSTADTPLEVTGSGVEAAPVDADPPLPSPSTAVPPDPVPPPSSGPAPVAGTVASPSPEPAPPPPSREPASVPPPAEPMPELLPPEPVPVAASPGPATEPVEAPAPVPGPASQPDSDRFVPLSGLSGEERRQLPPLKVSMHMWSEDPGRRFAIIDGNRVGEGDMVGSAVVTGITRDAVVLDWQGRRLEVPIR